MSLSRLLLLLILSLALLRGRCDDDDHSHGSGIHGGDDKIGAGNSDGDESSSRRIHHRCPCDGGMCFCVKDSLCKHGYINTDGAELLDARKTSEIEDMHSRKCSLLQKCCRLKDDNEHPSGHQCGISRPNGVDSRIMSSGQDGHTDDGEFPWQGAVLTNTGGNSLFKCACTLIGQHWALTVAHCVAQYRKVKPVPFFARFGVWDAQATFGYEDAAVSDLIIHPNFQNSTLKNDIALIKFTNPVRFNRKVAPICLPYYNETHFGETCVVIGWGKKAWAGSSFSTLLRKVHVPIVTPAECEEMLRKTRLGEFYKLDRSFLCAGGKKDQDACKGDGGGALACYREGGTYSVMGLASWGIGCGDKGVPGVYVNIPNEMKWIVDTTKEPASDFWPPKK